MSAQHSRRPAAYARIAATGVSLAGAVAMVGVMNAAAQSNAASVTDPPVTDAWADTTVPDSAPTSVVVIEVHRTVYVDENGNPVDADDIGGADDDDENVTQVPSTSAARRTTRTTVPASGSGGTTRTTVGPGSTSGSGAGSSSTAPPTTVRRTTTVPSCSGSGCP